ERLSDRPAMIVRLVQLVSTVHYLHYLQYQAGSFLETVLKTKGGGAGTGPRISRDEVQSMCRQLAGGKTCLLLMLNTRELFGHVVLVHAITATPDSSYLQVYDSNVQHGTESRPSVLKVSSAGRVLGYFRLEPGGDLKPDPIYDGDSWFSD